ncbi:cell division protein FtsW [Luteolibacter pohnpeiensis]|uniref:Probable peptidoglycan glycosyltransferase FtsW n=1 Tax=Luteolibacter pohnpeiensis TaxID=454153 RepID=A0A934S9P5_9BACT|nr:putative peptidoglycan glycosyltransferase FtsW [Luteolibacter pohnpeiensis]MBK1883456.1 cell division protein FtsW [Luteolibacter pohnpeiensis]
MLRHASILLIVCVGALVALGLTMLASTSVWASESTTPYGLLLKQCIMFGVGLVIAICCVFIHQNTLRKFYPIILIAASIALALCFVKGIGVEQWGSKRWIGIAGAGQIQPSEFAKIAVVLSLAGWFARWQTETKTLWRGFIIPGAMAGVPVLLIMLESDVGTALSLAVVTGAIFFCVCVRLAYLVPTALGGMFAAAFYVYNDPNRWARIQAWLDLENPAYSQSINFQHLHALYALGNGGATGVGLGNGVEKFGTLTLAYSDFILPAIGEELGLVATLGIVICYVLIAVCGVGIAVQADQVFNRCLALGLTCILVIPAMMHVGVTTALLPNDGVALPFVSYGGTNLVCSLISVGLLVGIQRNTREVRALEYPLAREQRMAVRL